MNIREMAEELRRAEEVIVFWKNSSAIRQKKLLEKNKEIERLNNIIKEFDNKLNKIKDKWEKLEQEYQFGNYLPEDLESKGE